MLVEVVMLQTDVLLIKKQILIQLVLVITLTHIVELLTITLVVLQLQMHKEQIETYHHTMPFVIL